MTSNTAPRVVSVNLARVRPNPHKEVELTGIDKRPVDGLVHVRAPGSKLDGLGSGLVGDTIGDRAHHGGDAQAVYAYASEDLAHWSRELGLDLAFGSFGENLTTQGIDVNRALIGERWVVGPEVELEITEPRTPCATFRGWIDRRGWLKTFTKAERPGAYLRVISPGDLAKGDPIVVSHRPNHGVTVALLFRAYTVEPELLPAIAEIVGIPD